MVDIIGIVDLSLTCLHGCVVALTVLSKAKHFHRDVSEVRLQIELAQHTLFSWAEDAGLTEEPPTLLLSARNAVLVPEVLGHLKRLLTNLKHLKDEYELHLQETHEVIKTFVDDDSIFSRLGPNALAYAKRADAWLFSKQKDPWKRLRWITFDEKKISKLLDRVRMYSEELHRLLEHDKQAARDRQMEFLLRDAVLNAHDRQSLGVIERQYGRTNQNVVAAAANLKQMRLQLGFSDGPASTCTIWRPTRQIAAPPAVTVPSQAMRLKMRHLTMSKAARAQTQRTLAVYDGSVVLLEWKYARNQDPKCLESRVNQVAAFLKSLGASFHSLQCRGFVEDQVAKRYGYIFDLPDAIPRSLQPGKRPIVEQKSLRQLMEENPSPPSLNDRLTISLALLENLLNLHTSGWLHKQICSENIIIIRPAGEDCGRNGLNLSQSSIYISGYVYSRADGPGEMTEPMESSAEADLYRHPALLGKEKLPYRKAFDIFSAGCTLLEIGLWTRLRDVLKKHSDPMLTETSRVQTVDDLTTVGDHGRCRRKSVDLMRLRYDLLLESLGKLNVGSRVNSMASDSSSRSSSLSAASASSTPSSFSSSRSSALGVFGKQTGQQGAILQSLEAATGRLYTSVTQRFLFTGTEGEMQVKEDDVALDIEMHGRDSINAILNSI